MKIYTKTGDKGTTSLYDGSIVVKHNIIFETIGEFDELSCRIGMLCSMTNNKQIILRKIQRTLQNINSHIATIDEKKKKKLPHIDEELIEELEKEIDLLEENTPRLTKFILPGVNNDDSQAHLCRVQTRKVERYFNKLLSMNSIEVEKKDNKQEKSIDTYIIPSEVIKRYINRLSDFFFVFSRWLCYEKGNEDCF